MAGDGITSSESSLSAYDPSTSFLFQETFLLEIEELDGSDFESLASDTDSELKTQEFKYVIQNKWQVQIIKSQDYKADIRVKNLLKRTKKQIKLDYCGTDFVKLQKRKLFTEIIDLLLLPAFQVHPTFSSMLRCQSTRKKLFNHFSANLFINCNALITKKLFNNFSVQLTYFT